MLCLPTTEGAWVPWLEDKVRYNKTNGNCRVPQLSCLIAHGNQFLVRVTMIYRGIARWASSNKECNEGLHLVLARNLQTSKIMS